MSGPRPDELPDEPESRPDPAPPEDGPGEPEDGPGQPETAPDGTAVSGFPETPGKDPGDRSGDPSPHHALNTPVGEPDPTEWPDPYEDREDPLAPSEELPFGEEPHPPAGSTSTSQPHPAQDPEAEPWEGPKRDRLDD